MVSLQLSESAGIWVRPLKENYLGGNRAICALHFVCIVNFLKQRPRKERALRWGFCMQSSDGQRDQRGIENGSSCPNGGDGAA